MKNRFLPLVGFSALLLLAGAGCKADSDYASKSAEGTTTQPNVEVNTEDKSEEVSTEGVTLQAEAKGNKSVRLEWTVPEELESTKTFRLVRSTSENPVYPGGFWYQVGGNMRAATWINVPTGPEHFRICTFVDNACEKYSNNVKVEVK